MQKLFYLLIGLALLNSPPLLADDDSAPVPPYDQQNSVKSNAQDVNDDC